MASGLFGAITSKPKNEANVELKPELRDKGLVYYSPIVSLRQIFDLDICIRPCRSFAGNPLNFIRRSADGGFEEPPVDAVIFRQNTEGLYGGRRMDESAGAGARGPEDAREVHPVRRHSRSGPRHFDPDLHAEPRVTGSCGPRSSTRRSTAIVLSPCAKSRTCCVRHSGMMEEEARAIQKEFPEIQHWSTNIDAQMMWLTKNPEDYSVIVAGNMFGDIVSDAFAGLVGGLGFACSANIGDEVAVFEPTHGSAPKYEALDPPIVNPIAMILTGAMMLDHVGDVGRANRIRAAVAAVVQEGSVKTYDMMKLTGGPDVIAQGAATTMAVTDAILEQLR